MSSTKEKIRLDIAGNPAQGVAGLQNDWWTSIAPDLWNSHNSYLRDVEGKEYLDLSSFFSTSVVRFDHPKIRDKAFLEQLARVAMYRPSLADFWTEGMADFVKTFRRVAVPPHMHHLFFIDGGSLSVENALKAAFDWKVRLNIQKGLIQDDPKEVNQPLGTKILSFERAFHGRSGYTLSMTHTVDPRKYKYFPKFDWFRINPPVFRFDNDGNIINQEEVTAQHGQAITEIKNILKDHADDIAAVMLEPIQCEGGDRHIPVEFFKVLRQLTDENDILLIYDEVQTGCGTTGTMWGHEHFGAEALPDIIAFCKKTQVGGVMANHEKMNRIPENVFGKQDECKSRLNSTWGGSQVDMLRCKAYLEIIEEEKLLQNVEKLGNYMLNGIRELCKEFSSLIENPRGRGFLFAFDTKSPDFKNKIWQTFYNENLLILTCGKQTIRFRPHLDLTRDEADEALKRMRVGLSKIK